MVGKHNLKNQGIRKALEVDQAMNAQGDETRENDDPIPGEVGSDLDEDHLSKSEHDTDTESEADEDDDNQAVRASASSDKSNVYVAESTNLEWSKSAPGTRRSCVTHAPGPQGAAKYAKEILQAFEIFFDEDLLKLLVENTNKYIEKVKCNFERSQDARDVSDSEMKAFLGVLIGMGVQQEGHASYTDIFNDANFSSDFFSTTMSSVRFMFILRCLRFDDTDTRMAYVTTDKLGPIRYLFDDIVTKCKKFYTTSEYVTIDEQLVAFRGKCGFKQCITSKQNKYGIKIFSMCDACTFYNSNMEVYLGKNYPEAAQNDDLAKSVVLRLIEPIRKTSRNLTTDKWFTSVSLADSLLHEHKVTLVGVVRSSNAEIPREFRADKSRAVKSSLFGFVTDKTLVSYVPKKRKSVTLLSTLHNNGKIDSETGQDAKPEILTFYESTKGAVEVNGKLCAIYSVARRTKRWPLAVFFHLLNVCCINAQVIYNSNCNKNMTRRNYLKGLAIVLVEPERKARLYNNRLPRTLRAKLEKCLGYEGVPVPSPVTQGVRKRCHICPRSKNRASKQLCGSCELNVCSEHAANLCLECYEEWNPKRIFIKTEELEDV